MADKSYAFAAASIKARENSIISFERAVKMADAADATEALRTLTETGYGGMEISDPAAFESLIAREMAATYDYIDGIMPERAALDVFELANDYHNLKVLLKTQALGKPVESAPLKKNTAYAPGVLLDAVCDKRYSALSGRMAAALAEIDRALSMNGDVSVIDLALDSAYGLELNDSLSESKSDFVREYMRVYADFTNVISFFRVRVLDYGLKTLRRVLLPMGVISQRTFEDAFEMPVDSASAVFERGVYAKRIGRAVEEFKRANSLFAFEKERDDCLVETIKKYNSDFMSPALALGYLIAKEREAANIRVIMSSKLNGLPKETTVAMLKEMF